MYPYPFFDEKIIVSMTFVIIRTWDGKEVLALARIITTTQIKRTLNKDAYTKTMLMARLQKIASLFEDNYRCDAMTKSGKSEQEGYIIGTTCGFYSNSKGAYGCGSDFSRPVSILRAPLVFR